MSSDDIVERLRGWVPSAAWNRAVGEMREAAAEIVRLRADYAELLVEYGRKHDYACSMDALAEKRLMEITRLRAERDASRLIINDLTAEVERLRAAGDALAVAIDKGDWYDDVPPAIDNWMEARRERP